MSRQCALASNRVPSRHCCFPGRNAREVLRFRRAKRHPCRTPCRGIRHALCPQKQLRYEKSFQFFADVQKTFYFLEFTQKKYKRIMGFSTGKILSGLILFPAILRVKICQPPFTRRAKNERA